MTQLEDAYFIRAARRFGYPAAKESGAEETGECPALPRWLWADDETAAEEEQWEDTR